MAWRNHIKYPALEGRGSRDGARLMDVLDELIPIEQFVPDAFDRLGIFLSWLRKGQELGLITYSEKDRITQELIHGCGGL